MKIRVGTRDSKLAMIQTEMVVDYINTYHSDVEIEIVPMKTTGDKILNVTLDKIGGKGLFVKELDEALLKHHVDITVHSFKDMPMEQNPELPIIAVSKREDSRDVFIMRKGLVFDKNNKDLVVGTSSKRREIQLNAMGYHNIKSIRGNLVTRLAKLDSGEFDAIVLAAAGVIRSGMEDRISEYFSVQDIIPAACQGNLAIQGRAGDDFSFLEGFQDQTDYAIAQGERAFVRKLDGGCSAPTAAYGIIEDNQLRLKGLYVNNKGTVFIKEEVGSIEDSEALGIKLAERMLKENQPKKGFVALVGAGPGEVSLLTLRAKELIETGDVIVYDRLVSSEIMKLIPQGKKRINVGKENNHHIIPQDQINEILLEEALAGNVVVRLKGGDPFVFGRGGEELETLVAHQIPFEVVPGITSSIAAPSFGGIPVTHRDFCSSFHVVTGHQKRNEDLRIDFKSLVGTKGTLVFLMGVSTLEAICQGLMEAGMEPSMPAALVENGTRAYQRKVVGTIENLYQKAMDEEFKSPSIIIVGKVCSLSQDFDWFSNRALYGEKIVVTSPTNSNGKLEKELKQLGAQVYDLPMIEIEPLPVMKELEEEILNISQYQYLVFTSKNGVSMFFDHLEKTGKDSRVLWNTKVVAVGPSTAETLKSYGIKADFMPINYNAQKLVETLLPQVKKEEKVLILRAEKGNYELIESLEQAQICYKELKVYRTVFVSHEEVKSLTEEKVTVCFTSASTVESFMENQPNIENVLGICIGEQTAAKARNYGINYEISEKASIDSMVEKVKEVLEHKKAK